MPSLSVRRIDDDVYELLKARAEEHGVSMEEEVRRLITQAVQPPERLGDLFRRYFGPDHGVDLELPSRELHEPVDLTE